MGLRRGDWIFERPEFMVRRVGVSLLVNPVVEANEPGF
jgi:hypothetical protein